MLRNTVNGIAAGILIAIGGCVNLSCENKVVGAILFSVALLCICAKGYALFTGKVGYLAESHKKDDVSVTLAALLGNTIATVLCGYAASYALPALSATARTVCETKLMQAPMETLIRAVFCGILMYLAVSIYKEKNMTAGIFFCVPVFILSGFEHSIANIFTFSASGIVAWRAFGYLMLVILGNTAGGLLLPMLSKVGRKETQNA